MSQSINFYKFKPVSEEFALFFSDSNLLKDWITSFFKDQEIEEDESLLGVILEKIETNFLIYLHEEDLISPLLAGKNNPNLLSEQSSFYFVDQEIWSAIETTILEDTEKEINYLKSKKIKDAYNAHVKFSELRSLQALAHNKLLIIRVS